VKLRRRLLLILNKNLKMGNACSYGNYKEESQLEINDKEEGAQGKQGEESTGTQGSTRDEDGNLVVSKDGKNPGRKAIQS